MTAIDQSPRLTARFNEALVFTAELHARQTRKGLERIPYIAHLLGVASLVIEAGGDEDMAIAALLHDAVEDQGGYETLDLIREKFGKRVAQIVEGCSDAFTKPKPPWCERKTSYIEHVREESDDEERLVSAADKLHNARSVVTDYRELGDEVFERFQGKKEGTIWYYRSLVQAFREARKRRPGSPELEKGTRRLVDELDRVVSELEKMTRTYGGGLNPCRE